MCARTPVTSTFLLTGGLRIAIWLEQGVGCCTSQAAFSQQSSEVVQTPVEIVKALQSFPNPFADTTDYLRLTAWGI